MTIGIGTGIWIGAGGGGASVAPLSASSSIASGVLTMRLASVPNTIPVASALELTLLDKDGGNVLGAINEHPDQVSPQLADTTNPGVKSGASGTKVVGMTSVTAGTLYLISYEITANPGGRLLFYPSGGPFPSGNPPNTVGVHHVLITAADADAGNAINLGSGSGDITFASMSIKRAQWTYDIPVSSDGHEIDFAISYGDETAIGFNQVPIAGEFYVAETGGSDTDGSGAPLKPFRTTAPFLDAMSPGDTAFFDEGTYPVFQPTVSGTSGNPITFKALPGKERLAVIEGALAQNATRGGPGGLAAGFASEDGIKMIGREYITIENLTVRNCTRFGISAVGAGVSTQTPGIIVRGNKVHLTGSAGIFIAGDYFTSLIGTSETTNLRMLDPLVELNDVSETNLPTDFVANPESEAISIGNGVENPIVQDNDVHDSQQYGIDFKSGVLNGIIRRNRVWLMERHGIYLDAGERFVTGCRVYDNFVWLCRSGIVLAREVDLTDDVHTLKDNLIYNNTVWDVDRHLIYAQNHPKDEAARVAGREGIYEGNKIRFNTLVNGNRDGTYADVPLNDYSAFTTATANGGNDFIGNLIYSDTDIAVVDGWTGVTGFTVRHNLNFADGAPTDPDFVDPDVAVVIGAGHRPTITLPDYSIQSGSPAEDLVTTAGDADAPFNADNDGNARTIPADAGSAEFTSDELTITDEGDGTLSVTWSGTLTSITIGGGGPHDGTYTAFHDGTALIASHLTGVAARALDITATTGTNAVGETLTAGDIFVLYADGQPVPAIAYQWQADGVDISGATSSTYVVQPGDAGADIRPTFILTASGQTTVIENGSAISIPSSLSLEFLSATPYPGSASTSRTYSVDLSSVPAGDHLMIVEGPGQVPTGCTVDGNSTTPGVTAVGGNGARAGVFYYTIPGGGLGTVDIVMASATSTRDQTLVILHGSGGAFADEASDFDGSGAQLSVTVTPINAANKVGFVTIGQDPNFDGVVGGTLPTISTGGEVANETGIGDGLDQGYSAGVLTNQSTSGVTILVDGDGAARYAMIAAVYE